MGFRVERIEAFSYEFEGGGVIVWDIDEAKRRIETRWVAEAEIDRAEMEAIKRKNAWTAEHAATVDPSRPGIAAPVIHEGQIIYILIDGVHRCVRALEENRPFRARLLTDEDSRAAILTMTDAETRVP